MAYAGIDNLASGVTFYGLDIRGSIPESVRISFQNAQNLGPPSFMISVYNGLCAQG
jgi:hypothetical protein